MKAAGVIPQRSAEVRSRAGLVAGLVWSLLVVSVLIIASRAGFLPHAPDEWTVDWRTLLFSERAIAQRTDIAVVLITEETLAQYPYRSPVDRGLLAALVRAIDQAGARALGLDFILDRQTEPEKDAALLAAIKAVKMPIVLGAIDRRTRSAAERHFAFQDEFLAATGRPIGHIYFAQQQERLKVSDQVIRYVMGPSTFPGQGESFAGLIAGLDGTRRHSASAYIAWLLPAGAEGSDTFAILSIPDHAPGSDPERILPPSWRAVLKDRIVLLGGDFIDRDQHLTPLSVADNSRMPGVIVHAQILAQLLDGRAIFALPVWAEFITLLLVAGLAFWLGRRFQLRRFDLLVYASSLVAIVALGIFLFSQFRLILPSTTVLFAWLVGVTGGHYCDYALRKLRLLP